jgi:hypothetical protein
MSTSTTRSHRQQSGGPNLKAQFLKQAAAYRKIAAERAAKYGLPQPSNFLKEK